MGGILFRPLPFSANDRGSRKPPTKQPILPLQRGNSHANIPQFCCKAMNQIEGDFEMSGHNKWSTIKHKKGAADAKRGKIFTKLIKEITVAAKIGGADPGGNPRLRTAIDKAKAENMPKDNVERAIKKGAGGLEGTTYEETTYEGYGPGGVAVLVEVMTDNRNRTVSDVRSIFSKCNGNMGESGCVSWLFDKKGLIVFPKGVDFDKLFEAALEAGADDVSDEEDQIEVMTDPASFIEVREALEKAGFKYDSAEVTMIPQTMVKLEGKQAESMLKLMDRLEDNDDVQNVYANFDISQEEMERMM
jgi:YebC/PmpR family DNA-binding regulatory protein